MLTGFEKTYSPDEQNIQREEIKSPRPLHQRRVRVH